MASSSYSSFTYFAVTFPYPYVAHVEINRPKKLNAFYEPMWLEFGRVFASLSSDPEVRAVVLSGAGDRAFTTGLDLQAASQGPLVQAAGGGDVARVAAATRRFITEFQDSIGAMEKCEKPVIAVIHGLALGLAVDIACAADIRICTPDVVFAVKEVDIGLAADIGTLSRLPKAVGNFSWVKEVCLSTREFGAEEALRVGFVSHVAKGGGKKEALQAGLGLAKTIADKSPVAVQGTKELLNHARDHSVAESLRYTTIWNSAALQSNDIKAAVFGAMQKKKPTFEKL